MIALAVDAGGTSTRAVVVAGDGTCLGFARSGSGTPVSAGLGLAAASVAAAAGEALARAGVSGAEAELCLVAMAGGMAPAEEQTYRDHLSALGLSVPLVFEGDALAIFCSGTWLDTGYALIVGTGAAAIRVEGGRTVVERDGLGWLLGDDGSGFWIGHHVVRAALAALEGRGPATKLTDLVLADVNGSPSPGWATRGRPPQLAAVMELLYQGRPVELARFAPLAFQAAPDPVADRIVASAAGALATTLASVMRPVASGPVVFGGGTLVHNPGLARRVAATLPTEPQLVTDGLAGAAVLALRAAGQVVDADVFTRIVQSLEQLRGGDPFVDARTPPRARSLGEGVEDNASQLAVRPQLA